MDLCIIYIYMDSWCKVNVEHKDVDWDWLDTGMTDMMSLPPLWGNYLRRCLNILLSGWHRGTFHRMKMDEGFHFMRKMKVSEGSFPCRFLCSFWICMQGRHAFAKVLLQHSRIHVHGISVLHWRMCPLADADSNGFMETTALATSSVMVRVSVLFLLFLDMVGFL